MNTTYEEVLPARQPRPLGLTMVSKHHQAQNTEITKSSVINHIITSYITTGFCFMGFPCSIEQLASLTSIPSASILKGISKASTGLAGLTDPNQLQETIRALQSIGINQTLQASGRMLEQADILRASQGNGYKAFISSTYNIALKNSLDASKYIMDMARQLQGPIGTTVNIQNNNHASTNEVKVSPAQVVAMIEDQNGRINPNEDHANNEALFLEHGLGDKPEVVASKQTNKGGNEGLGLKDITKIKASTTHEDRREEEYQIDSDADEV